MRSEEEPFYETPPVPLEGEVWFEGYKHSEVMVVRLHSKPLSLSRSGGWAYCLRCNRKYRRRKFKNCIIPIRGTYERHDGVVTFRIPRKRPKKNHCLSCGRVLNDKGEK